MLFSISSLSDLGQSVWLDHLTRKFIRNGNLSKLISSGITGVTTNPLMFYESIQDSKEYEADIKSFYKLHAGYFQGYPDLRFSYSFSVYDYLMIKDITEAADLFKDVYKNTGGEEGYVCVDIDPANAYRVPHVVENAIFLWKTINRPNIMIQIPATYAGMISIRNLTTLGINTNATFIFSLSQYEDVANSYIDGLTERVRRNQDISNVRSVASINMSKIDNEIDFLLNKLDYDGQKFKGQDVFGLAAEYNAKIIYDMYRILFSNTDFLKLKNKNKANIQKILWSSLTPKIDRYDDLKYINALASYGTITSVPYSTFQFLSKNKKNFFQSIDKGLPSAYDYVESWIDGAIKKDGLLFKDICGHLIESSISQSCVSVDEVIAYLTLKVGLGLEKFYEEDKCIEPGFGLV